MAIKHISHLRGLPKGVGMILALCMVKSLGNIAVYALVQIHENALRRQNAL